MMSAPRTGSSCALIIALALAACSASADSPPPPGDADDLAYRGSVPRDPHPRPPRDARTADAPPATDARTPRDAGGGTTSDGGPGGGGPSDGGLGAGGAVSCYSDFDPGATCALPSHCCFSNYSAAHAGSCDTASCTWGTIDCDGPEDCAAGERCCAHAMIDPDNGLTGYRLACQATACGAAPVDVELCHPGAAGTCGGGTTCVSAADHDYDLPRTLSICQ